jgi:hypothetical protein
MTEPPGIVERFADAVAGRLGRHIGADENFFDAGLDSVTLEALHAQVTGEAAGHFPITDLFAHPNLRALGRCWSEGVHNGQNAMPARGPRTRSRPAVAQIGRRRRELRAGHGGEDP